VSVIVHLANMEDIHLDCIMEMLIHKKTQWLIAYWSGPKPTNQSPFWNFISSVFEIGLKLIV